MINNLPAGFEAELNATSRKPIQLCHFHYKDQICLLSDSPVGIADGLLYDYDPIIESWGTIKDTSRLEATFTGSSLEVKSVNLSLIITGEYRDLLREAMDSGLDNTIVELYQWFIDTPNEPPQLIDVMVVQDPIKFSERSALLTVDLVSILMKNNPYLWSREPGEETRDIVVGKMTNMPLYNQQTSRVTAISQDLTFDYTGPVFIDNGVGFRAGPDKVIIDSETLSYDWISASTINITARGVDGTTARPHIRGALMCHPDAIFDYSICAGPVALVDNLKGNGEAYTQPVTFYPGQDPVIARFIGRPPWLKLSPGASGPDITPDPETSTEYGASTESNYGDGGSLPSSPDSINSASGSATMALSSTVAGGAGSFDYYNTTETEEYNVDGSSVNTYKLIGDAVYTYTRIQAQYNNYFGFPPPGETGHVGHIYNRDDSSYGELTGLRVDVTFSNSTYGRNTDFEVSIVFVKADGTESNLAVFTHLWYGMDFVQYTSYAGKTLSFDVSGLVADFAELQDCHVRMRYKNIRIGQVYFAEGSVWITKINWHVSYFTPSGTVPVPWNELASHFNRDLSSLGSLTSAFVNVRFNLSISNAQVYQAIIKRSTSNPANDSIIWSRTVTASQAAGTVNIDTGVTDFATLEGTRIGILQQIIGPDTEGVTRSSVTTFDYVQWVLTYQPGDIETPDEERIVYAEDLVCDVTSKIGADPTPAAVIKHLLDDHSSNGVYVDTQSFQDRNDEYDDDLYYFNGVLKGDIRLHEALKQCLKEGMARFLFSQGKIGLLNYSSYADTAVDYIFTEDEYFLRSKAQENQPTSTIINDVSVLYDYNPSTDEFDSKHVEVDSDSISSFERQESREEYTLIRSDSVAERIANYKLDRLSRPITVQSFDVFMSGYVLQKGDRVLFHTLFDGYKAVGHIASIDRVVGQGKNNIINKFRIAIADAVSASKRLDLSEFIGMDDRDIAASGAIVHLDLLERVNVDDSRMSRNLSLVLTEDFVVDDTNYIPSIKKVLLLNDSVEITEEQYKAIHLQLTDNVIVDDSDLAKNLSLVLNEEVIVDDSDFEGSTAKRVKLFDVVEIDDTSLVKKRQIHLQLIDGLGSTDDSIVTGLNYGYGEGGYGDGEYGL